MNADKLTSGVSVPMRWIDFGLSFFLLGVCALITFPMVMGWVRTPVTSLFKPLVISSTPGSGFPVNSHLPKHFYILLLSPQREDKLETKEGMLEGI